MDFSKDSLLLNLQSQNKFDATIPSAWILEGLVMYLKRTSVERLLGEISALSASQSYLILNFSENAPGPDGCPRIDEINQRLQSMGWKQESTLFFGEEGFQFNRYPKGKPANKILGFAMYQKL
jgi:O-methyltransferase involved in polyketide biosynthesis